MPLARILLPIALAALALPALIVRLPPVADYPNHWARLWLLAGGAEQPPLTAMYAIDFSLVRTNIGIDLLGLTLGRIIGADALAPLLLALAAILPAWGGAMLNRRLFGGWHWWQIGFAVFAWNATLVLGFLNFQIGLGLALLLAAVDAPLAARGRAISFMARAAFAVLLIVVHVFAACFYGALLVALALGPQARLGASLRAPLATLRRALPAMLAVVTPLLLLTLLAPVVPGAQASDTPSLWSEYSLLGKVAALCSGFVTYDPVVDGLFVLGVWLVARVLMRSHPVRIHGGMFLLPPLLILATLVLPPSLAAPALIDWRLPIIAILALLAGFRPEAPSSRRANLAGLLLLAMALGRTAWMTNVWSAREADARSVERALLAVPAGAAVLPVVPLFEGDAAPPTGRNILGIDSFAHWPVMAIAWRQGFVPTLFSARGKQPIRVLPPWSDIAASESGPFLLPWLVHFPDAPFADFWFGYGREWRTRYDYLVVLAMDGAPARSQALSDPSLELVTDEGFARLYRIRRSPN